MFVCAGPGRAWSAKEQGEYLFKLAGKKERFISAPVGLMDGIISCFDGLTRFFPGLEVSCLPSRAPPQLPVSLLCCNCHIGCMVLLMLTWAHVGQAIPVHSSRKD